MARPRPYVLQRPTSYVLRQLAIRITGLARIVSSNRRELNFARETIFAYMHEIGIDERVFEDVYTASMRLIREARSVDLDYVLDAIPGIFDTMYPHDEL